MKTINARKKMTKSGHRYLAILIKFLHSFLNTFEYDLLLASLGKEGRQPKMQSNYQSINQIECTFIFKKKTKSIEKHSPEFVLFICHIMKYCYILKKA